MNLYIVELEPVETPSELMVLPWFCHPNTSAMLWASSGITPPLHIIHVWNSYTVTQCIWFQFHVCLVWV